MDRRIASSPAGVTQLDVTFSNRSKCGEGRLVQSLGRTCRLFLSTKECHGAVIVRAPSTEELPATVSIRRSSSASRGQSQYLSVPR